MTAADSAGNASDEARSRACNGRADWETGGRGNGRVGCARAGVGAVHSDSYGGESERCRKCNGSGGGGGDDNASDKVVADDDGGNRAENGANDDDHIDDGDDDSTLDTSNLRLGFIVPPSTHSHTGNNDQAGDQPLTPFESKAGGYPAFLHPTPPHSLRERTTCRACAQPLTFLVQLYAPVIDAAPRPPSPNGDAAAECDGFARPPPSGASVPTARADCFHRALYLFVCATRKCHARDVHAFRCQLPRANAFYPASVARFDALVAHYADMRRRMALARDDADVTDANAGASGSANDDNGDDATRRATLMPLCRVCGFTGRARCAKCDRAWYCARVCQIRDWKRGDHRAYCAGGGAVRDAAARTAARDAAAAQLRFAELEIEVSDIDADAASSDDDEFDDGVGANGGAGIVSSRVGTELASGAIGTMQDASESELREAGFDADGDGTADDATHSVGGGGGGGVTHDPRAALPAGSAAQQRASAALVDSAVDFERAVRDAPAQVLRYHAPSPTWPSQACAQRARADARRRIVWHGGHARLDPRAVPRCQRCDAPRRFEFQVMPQLLYYLYADGGGGGDNDDVVTAGESMAGGNDDGDDTLDFGTIAVWTCAASCGAADTDTHCEPYGAYCEEFAYMQPPQPSSMGASSAAHAS